MLKKILILSALTFSVVAISPLTADCGCEKCKIIKGDEVCEPSILAGCPCRDKSKTAPADVPVIQACRGC